MATNFISRITKEALAAGHKICLSQFKININPEKSEDDSEDDESLPKRSLFIERDWNQFSLEKMVNFFKK